MKTLAQLRSASVGFAILICFAAFVRAQGSREDYERAANLSRQFSGKVFRDRIETHWLTGDTSFWYEVKTGRDTSEFFFVDAVKGERKPSIDVSKFTSAEIN